MPGPVSWRAATSPSSDTFTGAHLTRGCIAVSRKDRSVGRPAMTVVGRRGFLTGAAAVSAGAVVGRQADAAQAATSGDGLHGVELEACT